MAEPMRCPTKNALEVEHDGKQFGTYVATVPAGHTLEDVLSPDYFGQMQSRGPTDKLLRPGDMIDVRSEDWSWYVRLMVRACLPSVDRVVTAALVGPVNFEIGELPKGWSVTYKGIERKWTVIYNGVEKAALFRSSEEAVARVYELSGFEPEAAAPVRNKPGRKPKAQAEPEAETV